MAADAASGLRRLPALLLAAGLGTRFSPLSLTRAKPAAPVAGVPLIDCILRWLAREGIADVVVNLHYRAATLTRIVGDGSHAGVRARYSIESPGVLGSAGGPRHALPLLDAPRFLVVNGDTLTDVALSALEREHAVSGALVTLTVVPNREPHRYGGVLVDDDGAVVGFTRRGDTRASWHFVGIQLAERDAFAGLEDGVPADSIPTLYGNVLRTRPGAVHAWRTDAPFVDIGTPTGYLRTCIDVARVEGVPVPLIGARCHVPPSARITDSVLWDDVIVGTGAILDHCVIADGVSIPAGERFAWKAVAPAGSETPAVAGGQRHGDLVIVPLEPWPDGNDRTPRDATL